MRTLCLGVLLLVEFKGTVLATASKYEGAGSNVK